MLPTVAFNQALTSYEESGKFDESLVDSIKSHLESLIDLKQFYEGRSFEVVQTRLIAGHVLPVAGILFTIEVA